MASLRPSPEDDGGHYVTTGIVLTSLGTLGVVVGLAGLVSTFEAPLFEARPMLVTGLVSMLVGLVTAWWGKRIDGD